MSIAVDPRLGIPTANSEGSAWIQWYKSLRDAVGKKQANDLFLKFWAKRGNYNANTHELREFLKTQGIDLETNALSSLYDTGAGFIDGIGDFFGGLKTLGIVVIVLVIGGIITAVLMLMKNSSVRIVAPAMA